MVGQLDAEQHQTEPGLEELFVAGGEVVRQAPGLQVGEKTAGPSVSQEGAEVTPGRHTVVRLVVRQGEGEVEMVALQSSDISSHKTDHLQPRGLIYHSPLCTLSPLPLQDSGHIIAGICFDLTIRLGLVGS